MIFPQLQNGKLLSTGFKPPYCKLSPCILTYLSDLQADLSRSIQPVLCSGVDIQFRNASISTFISKYVPFSSIELFSLLHHQALINQSKQSYILKQVEYNIGLLQNFG